MRENSDHEAPSARVVVVEVELLALVRLVQEPHVSVEVDWSMSLDDVFYVQVVPCFEKDRRVIDEDTVKNRINSHAVPDYLGNNFIDKIIINRILHIVRSELVFVTSLVKYVIFEHLNHNVETS